MARVAPGRHAGPRCGVGAARLGTAQGFGKRIGDGTVEAVSRLTEIGVGESLEAALTRIERALAKLDEGSYGRCDSCGEEIDPARLRARPDSSLCMRCAAGEARTAPRPGDGEGGYRSAPRSPGITAPSQRVDAHSQAKSPATRGRARSWQAPERKHRHSRSRPRRRSPIGDARHVRNAVARFNQVEGVSDRERDAAWRRIRAAARRYGVDIEVRGWRQLMKKRS